MLAAIQKTVHCTRTVNGDSEPAYGRDDLGKWENWPQGVLQGNTSSLLIWLALSSVIFYILHKREFISNMVSYISKQLFTLVRFSFGDDCDLFQVGTDPVTIINSMQNMINTCDSIMKVTCRVIRTDNIW